ncbi:type II toxin-antitoxin system PemK/MazF family toxin [Microcoleus sp. bin38.metabat.b11b12b14.051]|nr:type II toxin-antitoxin system PemK/MazF family toxin [Microcoleus sp. bin38.metabat.b11b12b14.051]
MRLNFDPQAGHEQMGTRPALVVSQTKFNIKMGFDRHDIQNRSELGCVR